MGFRRKKSEQLGDMWQAHMREKTTGKDCSARSTTSTGETIGIMLGVSTVEILGKDSWMLFLNHKGSHICSVDVDLYCSFVLLKCMLTLSPLLVC